LALVQEHHLRGVDIDNPNGQAVNEAGKSDKMTGLIREVEVGSPSRAIAGFLYTLR
jgi:hypothetical protein